MKETANNYLLAIDVGNTNLTFGIFRGSEIIGTFRMTTKLPRTSDEFGIWIKNLLAERDVMPEQLCGVIVASVVPGITSAMGSPQQNTGTPVPFTIAIICPQWEQR